MSLRRPTAACTVFTFCYKPFMWCRPDARLWHYYSAFSSRGVFQTLVWHQYYYSCIFRSRSHSDPRLAPSIYFGISGGLPPDFSVISPCIIVSMSERTCYSVHMLHVYICYILCPNCLASTFIVLTWLVDLARC